MNQKQPVPMREREAYRAAIDAHLAGKERIRNAVLGAERKPGMRGRGRVHKPLVRAAAIAAALLLCTLSGCGEVQTPSRPQGPSASSGQGETLTENADGFSYEEVPAYDGALYVAVHGNVPYR